jgi:hypothetical protein
MCTTFCSVHFPMLLITRANCNLSILLIILSLELYLLRADNKSNHVRDEHSFALFHKIVRHYLSET